MGFAGLGLLFGMVSGSDQCEIKNLTTRNILWTRQPFLFIPGSSEHVFNLPNSFVSKYSLVYNQSGERMQKYCKTIPKQKTFLGSFLISPIIL